MSHRRVLEALEGWEISYETIVACGRDLSVAIKNPQQGVKDGQELAIAGRIFGQGGSPVLWQGAAVGWWWPPMVTCKQCDGLWKVDGVVRCEGLWEVNCVVLVQRIRTSWNRSVNDERRSAFGWFVALSMECSLLFRSFVWCVKAVAIECFESVVLWSIQ